MFGLFRKKNKVIQEIASSNESPKQATEEAPLILRKAARSYLEGDTAGANLLVSTARKECPDYFDKYSQETEWLVQDLRTATENRVVDRAESSDHYTDDHCRAYWESAHREIATQSSSENVNAMIFELMTKRIAQAIERLGPDGVLDFGCAYGRALYELANKFPSCAVAGVDRQGIWKELNDANFQRSNLEYFASSVFPALARVQGGNKMLLHIRTGIMVYPEFLAKLYTDARAAGYKHVIIYEIASLSCDSWTFRDQGSDFASEAHRSTMFIHDYSSYLKKAGFTQQRVERMPHAYHFPKNTMLEGDTYVYIEASCPL